MNTHVQSNLSRHVTSQAYAPMVRRVPAHVVVLPQSALGSAPWQCNSSMPSTQSRCAQALLSAQARAISEVVGACFNLGGPANAAGCTTGDARATDTALVRLQPGRAPGCCLPVLNAAGYIPATDVGALKSAIPEGAHSVFGYVELLYA